MEIHTRKEAISLGLRKYYTGRLCNRGHDAMRSTSTGACVGCLAKYAKDYKKKIMNNLGGYRFVATLRHYDDIKKARAYVDALNFEREYGNG